MGHARTYVAFDVIRRIMTSFFGYDVCMVMNVTDIDDKIIKRSQEQVGLRLRQRRSSDSAVQDLRFKPKCSYSGNSLPRSCEALGKRVL